MVRCLQRFWSGMFSRSLLLLLLVLVCPTAFGEPARFETYLQRLEQETQRLNGRDNGPPLPDGHFYPDQLFGSIEVLDIYMKEWRRGAFLDWIPLERFGNLRPEIQHQLIRWNAGKRFAFKSVEAGFGIEKELNSAEERQRWRKLLVDSRLEYELTHYELPPAPLASLYVTLMRMQFHGSSADFDKHIEFLKSKKGLSILAGLGGSTLALASLFGPEPPWPIRILAMGTLLYSLPYLDIAMIQFEVWKGHLGDQRVKKKIQKLLDYADRHGVDVDPAFRQAVTMLTDMGTEKFRRALWENGYDLNLEGETWKSTTPSEPLPWQIKQHPKDRITLDLEGGSRLFVPLSMTEKWRHDDVTADYVRNEIASAIPDGIWLKFPEIDPNRLMLFDASKGFEIPLTHTSVEIWESPLERATLVRTIPSSPTGIVDVRSLHSPTQAVSPLQLLKDSCARWLGRLRSE